MGEARRLHVGYQATWIADIGLKTGLFQAIADTGGGITDTDVAARRDRDPRYAQLWCPSAYAFELLEATLLRCAGSRGGSSTSARAPAPICPPSNSS